MVAALVAMICYMISYLIYETGDFFHWKLETTDGRKYRVQGPHGKKEARRKCNEP